MLNYKSKADLLKACFTSIEFRINAAKKAMAEAQQAANEETKGSVGDKHETTRAMMQIERDKHARMLANALEQKEILEKINLEKKAEKVSSGHLVITESELFFISIGVGKILFEGHVVYAIAPLSPLGMLLTGKKVNDQVSFNEKKLSD